MIDKIKMIELFGGIGSQERAMRQLNIPFEVTHYCDLDKDATLSYAAMRYNLEEEMKSFEFPPKEEMIAKLQEKNIGLDFKTGKQTINERTNIDKLKLYYLANELTHNLGDISKVDKLPYADVVTYSFPCFVPGTMVLTDNGYKNIEDIQEGDMVLTHTNQYQKVIKPMKNYCNSYVYKINAMCSDPIYTTEEHPFYVRKRHRVSNPPERYSNGKLKIIRKFDEPEWVKAKDLTKDYYVGVAINQKSEIPKWDGVTFKWSNSTREEYSNVLGKYMNNEDFWWIIGRYIGDGWLVDGYGKNPSYGIKICCAQEETSEITIVLDRLGIHYIITTERTVNKIQISGKEWHMFCSQFGRGAANKHLTSTILNLPVNLLKGFLDGYISADGNLDKKQNVWKATSVSRELMYEIGQCVAKVYSTPFSVYRTKRPKTCVIEGRVVNQKDSYNITFKTDKRKQDHAFYEDGYIWCPINDISTEEYNGYVYNMEVENDNSYVVQNIIVHNCTDLSVAGKGEGMVNKCGICGHSWPIDFSNAEEALVCPNCGATVSSSTRSGLLGQVQRLLSITKENGTLPKYLLLENVKNLVGKKFKPQFDAWIKWLDSIGYNTYYKVLNAKHFGIPQNRERIFAISIRKDIDTNGFTFPEPIPLTTRLKDILEHNVDEKYYLPDDRIEKILNSSFMQEKKRIQTTDVCDTLLARDWKDPKCVPVEEDVNPIRIGNIYDESYGTGYAGNVWDKDGISPTLQTAQGGNRQPLVLDEIKVVGNYMPSNHDASRVVDIDGIAPTVKENHGTVTAIAEPQIIKVDIPQIVKIRTYEVDTDKLSTTLKEHKKAVGLTNKDIANQLNKPLTLVEHWFRTDECFSIPDPEIWLSLKALLKIDTDEFDKSIMTFEERPGVFEKSNRCYHQDGISPTITCVEGEKVIVNSEPQVRKVGQASSEGSQCGTVYSTDGLSPTLTAGCHGYAMGYIVEEQEPFIVASRGRNPENPSDRTTGIKTEQRFEPNKEGICNCLTSVQKDSYVVEPQVLRAERTEYGKAIRKQYESGEIDEKIGNMRVRVPRTDGISNTITTVLQDNYVAEPQTINKPRVYPGARFGRLVAKRDTGEKQGTNHIWECDCDCGNTCYVNTGRLGITTNSCGCLKIDSHRTHHMSNTRLYRIWCLMKGHCFNKNLPNYENYGARGITVCDEWLKFENFYEWAVNNGYREDLTIERKNNDGNYEPSNCKWADLTTQVNNRRNWGEIEYYGIVKDNTGYRAQVTVNGKKIYIAHSTDDIEYLVNERNKYIDEHNLPNKKNVFKKSEDIELDPIIYDDYNSRIPQDQNAITTLTTNCGASAERNGVKIIEPIVCEERKDEGLRFFKDDCVGTLRTIDACGDKRVLEPEINPKLVGGIGEKNFGKQYRQGNRVYDSDEIAMALNAQPVGNTGGYSYLYAVEEEQPKIRWRIRKLTPKETTRLMNFTDKDYEAMAKYVSASSIYKADGNSIVVACLIAIFSSLFLEDGYKADVWTQYSLNYWD